MVSIEPVSEAALSDEEKLMKKLIEASERICKHMNEDHPDSLLAYAHHYAKKSAAKVATLTAISGEAWIMTVEMADGTKEEGVEVAVSGLAARAAPAADQVSLLRRRLDLPPPSPTVSAKVGAGKRDPAHCSCDAQGGARGARPDVQNQDGLLL